MFTGFRTAKKPVYEVITPQTKLSFKLRSLTVREEERLKASLLTPSKVTEHLNQCIFDSIDQKPESITDFKSFLQSLTIKDRDALLYGLYHVSYEEIRNYDVKCASCSKEFPVTIKASSTFNVTPYPDNDILTKRVRFNLPEYNGVWVVLKQPTLEDELKGLKDLGTSNLDTLNKILPIESIEEENNVTSDQIIFKDKTDILDAFKELIPKDKNFITEKYNETFGKYGIDLKMKTFCAHCGHSQIVGIDLVENFFRMVFI